MIAAKPSLALVPTKTVRFTGYLVNGLNYHTQVRHMMLQNPEDPSSVVFLLCW